MLRYIYKLILIDMDEIILGIDPGIVNLGWCVVAKSKMKVLEYGCCISDQKEDWDKFINIEKTLTPIIKKYKPVTLIFEQPSRIAGQNGPRINEAIGIVKMVCRKHGIKKMKFCEPTKLKKAVTTSGKADKKDIQLAVQKHFKMDILPEPDHAADAIGAVYWYIKN